MYVANCHASLCPAGPNGIGIKQQKRTNHETVKSQHAKIHDRFDNLDTRITCRKQAENPHI